MSEVPFTETPTEGPLFEEDGDGPSIYDLFDAPDFTVLLRPAQTKAAKEYTVKVNSVLKALLVGSINAGDMPDAAAILKHGPGFAASAGQFADSSEWAARAVDMLTAPASPAMMFLMTGIPLVAQILRNHEGQIEQIPEARRQAKAMRKQKLQAKRERQPRFTIRIFKREIPIYFDWKPKFGKIVAPFKSQTQDPELLALQAFTDPKVVDALKKQGILLVRRDNGGPV